MEPATLELAHQERCLTSDEIDRILNDFLNSELASGTNTSTPQTDGFSSALDQIVKDEGTYVTPEPANHTSGTAYQETETSFLNADSTLTPKYFSHCEHPGTIPLTQLSEQVSYATANARQLYEKTNKPEAYWPGENVNRLPQLENCRVPRSMVSQGNGLPPRAIYNNYGPNMRTVEQIKECSHWAAVVTWQPDGTGHFFCNSCGVFIRINSVRQPPVRTYHKKINNGKNNASCANCQANQTTLWRRSNEGERVCNACGLYFRLHGVNRPVIMNKNTIQKRKRKQKNPGVNISNPENEISSTGENAGSRDKCDGSDRSWQHNSLSFNIPILEFHD